MELENSNDLATRAGESAKNIAGDALRADWIEHESANPPGAEGHEGKSKEDGSPGEGGGEIQEIPGLPDVQFDGPSIEFKGCGELKIKR